MSAHLAKIGFVRGIGHPSVYHHPGKGFVTLVHGDDYTTAGGIEELLWFKKRLEETYEIKTQLIIPKGEITGKVPNRVTMFTGSGFELEADQGTVK